MDGGASVLWQSWITGNKLLFVHKSAQVQVPHPASVTKVIFESASEPEPLVIWPAENADGVSVVAEKSK